MNDIIYFTDNKGNPVSHEYMEMQEYTKNLEIPGQLMLQMKVKEGILIMCAMCESEEDFINVGKAAYKQLQKYKKANK